MKGAPAKGFVTSSWRIRCAGKEHMVNETRFIEKADCRHEIKTLMLLQKKQVLFVHPWFQKLLWFETARWGR